MMAQHSVDLIACLLHCNKHLFYSASVSVTTNTMRRLEVKHHWILFFPSVTDPGYKVNLFEMIR